MVTKLVKRHLFLFNVQKIKLFPLFLSFSLVKQMVCDKKGVIINRELLCACNQGHTEYHKKL